MTKHSISPIIPPLLKTTLCLENVNKFGPNGRLIEKYNFRTTAEPKRSESQKRKKRKKLHNAAFYFTDFSSNTGGVINRNKIGERIVVIIERTTTEVNSV